MTKLPSWSVAVGGVDRNLEGSNPLHTALLIRLHPVGLSYHTPSCSCLGDYYEREGVSSVTTCQEEGSVKPLSVSYKMNLLQDDIV